MATESVATLSHSNLGRLNGAPINVNDLVQSGTLLCMRALKSDANGWSALITLPANLTFTTGLTFRFSVTDDGDPANLGKVAVFGITVKKIASGADSFDISVNAGTEQTVSLTLNATSGVAVLGSLAIANANLDSAGAGDAILIRVRRTGSNASDTAPGNVLIGPVYVSNT
jgi:hypothetical protein